MKKINMEQENFAAKPIQLKISNRKMVMSILKDGIPRSIAEIVQLTGISRQTVTKALDHFIKKNLVKAIGKGESTDIGGKKPNLFQLSAEKKMLVIQLRGKNFLMTLCDLHSNEIGRVGFDSDTVRSHDFIYFIQLIRKAADDLFIQSGEIENNLYGIAVITPGSIEKNEILRYSSYNNSWGKNIPIVQYIREVFPCAEYVFVENIGKMAGYGSIIRDEEKYRDLRVMTVYTYYGISGCLFDHGKMIEGSNSIIGEFGHMIIDPASTTPCHCGKFGCFESLVHFDSICRRIQKGKDFDAFSTYIHKPLSELTFNDIIRGAEKGFSCCENEFRQIASYFAQAFHNIAVVCDPDVFIIQGFFSTFNNRFEDILKDHLADFCLLSPDRYYHLEADKCPLIDLELNGAIHAMKEYFFADESTYE